MLFAFPALRPPPPPAAAPAPLAAARLCVACMKEKSDKNKGKSETKKEFRRFYRVMGTVEKMPAGKNRLCRRTRRGTQQNDSNDGKPSFVRHNANAIKQKTFTGGASTRNLFKSSKREPVMKSTTRQRHVHASPFCRSVGQDI
mmetsp:Transcript_10732/g.15043  ORF Transcript_10732/g.15043 Transcript_10732/m.15043 type:complete len:143 (+) Transcript_10732:393-821(+)